MRGRAARGEIRAKGSIHRWYSISWPHQAHREQRQSPYDLFQADSAYMVELLKAGVIEEI